MVCLLTTQQEEDLAKTQVFLTPQAQENIQRTSPSPGLFQATLRPSPRVCWFLTGLLFILVHCLTLVSSEEESAFTVYSSDWPIVQTEEVGIELQEPVLYPLENNISVYSTHLEREHTVLVSVDAEMIHVDRFSEKMVRNRVSFPHHERGMKTVCIATTFDFNGFLRVSTDLSEKSTYINLYERHPSLGLVEIPTSLMYPEYPILCLGRSTFGKGDKNFFCLSAYTAFGVDTMGQTFSNVDISQYPIRDKVTIVDATIGNQAIYYVTDKKLGIHVLLTDEPSPASLPRLLPMEDAVVFQGLDTRNVRYLVANPFHKDRLFFYSSTNLNDYHKYALADIICSTTEDNKPYCNTMLVSTAHGHFHKAISLFVVSNLNFYGVLTETHTSLVLMTLDQLTRQLKSAVYFTADGDHLARSIPQVLVKGQIGTALMPVIRSMDGHSLPSVAYYTFRRLVCKCSEIDPQSKRCRQCEHGCYLYDNSCATLEQWSKKGLGYNPINRSVSPCASRGCLSCGRDFRICDLCNYKASPPYYLHPLNHQCYNYLPENFGLPVGLSHKLSMCSQDLQCKTCAWWKGREFCLTCWKFKQDVPGSGFIIKELTNNYTDLHGKCITFHQAPRGMGFDRESLDYFRPCKLPGCSHCLLNFANCLSCYPISETGGPTYLFNYTDGKQKCTSLLPETYGIHNSKLVRCNTTNCSQCFFDQTIGEEVAERGCLRCQKGFVLSPNRTVCIKLSPRTTLDKYYLKRFVNGSGTFIPCVDKHCQNCQKNESQCILCRPPYLTDKRTHKCVDPHRFLITTPTQCVRKPYILNCPNACLNCSSDCSKCFQCAEDYWIAEDEDHCVPGDHGLTNRYEGYGIDPMNQVTKLNKCRDNRCLDCQRDYVDCVLCEEGFKPKRSYHQGQVYPSGSGGRRMTAECVPADTTAPPGYGEIPGLIQECRVGSCESCSDPTNPFYKCERCSSGYLDPTLSGQICIKEDWSEDIRGFGMVEGNRTLAKPCTVPLCSLCKWNYQACEACHEGSFLLDGKCIQSGEIPEGYIADPVTRTVVCGLPRCKRCSNFTTNSKVRCEQCEEGFVRLPWPNNTCIDPTGELVVHFGPHTKDEKGVATKYAACSTKKCLYCPRHYSECVKCIPSHFLYVFPRRSDKQPGFYYSTNVCLGRSEISSGYTILDGQVTKCGVIGCKSCPEPQSCKVCYGSFMLTTDGICLPKESIKRYPGWGYIKLHEDNGWVMERCEKYTPGCSECSGDARNCTECANSEGWYQLEKASMEGVMECVNVFGKDKRAQGMGLKRTIEAVKRPSPIGGTQVVQRERAELVPCKHKGCKSCLLDYSRCQACPQQDHVINSQGKCVSSETVYTPSSNVPSNENSKSSMCHPRGNCKSCTEHYMVCSSCYEGFILQQNTCKPEVLARERHTQGSYYRLKFKLALPTDVASNVEIIVVSKDKEKTITCPHPHCKISRDPSSPHHLLLYLRPQQVPFSEGTVFIRRNLSVLNRYSAATVKARLLGKLGPAPDILATSVLVDEFRFSPQTTFLHALLTYRGVYTVINSLRAVGTVVLIFQRSPNPMFASEVFSTLSVIDLLAGPRFLASELILEGHREWRILVVELPNPFGHWMAPSTKSAVPPRVSPNVLFQFGHNFLALTVIFFICGIIQWVYLVRFKVRELGEPPRRVESQGRRVLRSFGIPFFIQSTLALQLPVLVFSVDNCLHGGESREDNIGRSVAHLCIGYYVMVTLMSLYVGEYIWRVLSDGDIQDPRIPTDSKDTEEEKIVPLDHLVDFRTLPFGLLSFLFEGLRKPVSRMELGSQTGNFIRALAMSFSIAGFQDDPEKQLTAVLITEGLTWAVKLLGLRVLVDRVHGLINLVSTSLTLLFLLLRSEAYKTGPHGLKHKHLGAASVVLVFMLWFCCLFEFVYVIVRHYLSVITQEKIGATTLPTVTVEDTLLNRKAEGLIAELGVFYNHALQASLNPVINRNIREELRSSKADRTEYHDEIEEEYELQRQGSTKDRRPTLKHNTK